MRIVNLEQFRALPPWTLFRKYEPCVAGDLEVKFDTLESDFVSMTLDFPESNGSDQLFDRLFEMAENGTSYPLDIDCAGRDGLFEEKQMFLIYEPEDVRRLASVIARCLSPPNHRSQSI